MPIFRYRAIDPAGTFHEGELTAANIDEARGQLLERGWSIQELATSSAKVSPLNADQASEFVDHISRLAASGFPLGDGLRAAAEETPSHAVAHALHTLAAKIDEGRTLEAILQDSTSWLPPHIAGLITVALRSGRLSQALVELVEHQRRSEAERQHLQHALMYPATVAFMAMALLLAIALFITSSFERMFIDFQIQLPLPTRLLFWWRDVGIWVLLVLVAFTVFAGWIWRKRIGSVGWYRVWSAFPLVGPFFYLRGLAEWSGLMTVLVRNQIPLSDALRWSAAGIRNPWVADVSRTLAEETSTGGDLSSLILRPGRFPATLSPLIRWGEEHGRLAEAFASSRELIDRRLAARSQLLRTFLPPWLFISIGSMVLGMVAAMFQPLFSLLQGLS